MITNTGPWDLDALTAPPACELREGPRVLSEVYYENEPCRGRPSRVFAYYGAPEGEGPHPGVVLVHGGGGKAFANWVEMWVERGYAAIAMDLGGKGPDGAPMADGGPDQSHTQKFDDLADGVECAWPYHAVAAVVRAASFLCARPEVDADRIGLTGISWGGYLTSLVAGLGDRLRFAVPVYGCGFLHHNSAWLDQFAAMPAELRDRWIALFDPSQYLPGAARPMLWVNGTNDFAYPLDSHRESYRAAPGPTTLCIQVGMAHGHEPGWAPVEIGLFADQVVRGGVPLPRLGEMAVEGDAAAARFESDTPVVAAGLHTTADTGAWQQRAWTSHRAAIDGNTVRAALPEAGPLVAFMTLTDDRGATVSTPYVGPGEANGGAGCSEQG